MQWEVQSPIIYLIRYGREIPRGKIYYVQNYEKE